MSEYGDFIGFLTNRKEAAVTPEPQPELTLLERAKELRLKHASHNQASHGFRFGKAPSLEQARRYRKAGVLQDYLKKARGKPKGEGDNARQSKPAAQEKPKRKPGTLPDAPKRNPRPEGAEFDKMRRGRNYDDKPRMVGTNRINSPDFANEVASLRADILDYQSRDNQNPFNQSLLPNVRSRLMRRYNYLLSLIPPNLDLARERERILQSAEYAILGP